jgi:hypothetical protein
MAGVELFIDGGDGRDLIIAGDTPLSFGGGAGQDILVAGKAKFDNDPAAIDAIMSEWTRDLEYAERVEHLLHGGGLNGEALLNVATFTRNAGPNTMTGGDDLDLFFGSKTNDAHDWNGPSGEIFVDADQVNHLAVAAELDRDFGFYAMDNLFEDDYGGGEKWFRDLAGRWYFILPGGELYRWSNQGSLTGELLATLDPSFHQDIHKLVNAQLLYAGGLDQDPLGPLAAQLDRDLNLNAIDELFFNYGGRNERWLVSGTYPTTVVWYFILPSGELYRWDGTINAATGTKVAALDASFYQDISKLVDGQYLFGA